MSSTFIPLPCKSLRGGSVEVHVRAAGAGPRLDAGLRVDVGVHDRGRVAVQGRAIRSNFS